jgi:hypothetical protein
MEAVLDWQRYRRAKFIGVALLLAAAASLGAAAYVSNTNTLPDYLRPVASNQCDLPLAQRTGGWACPSP